MTIRLPAPGSQDPRRAEVWVTTRGWFAVDDQTAALRTYPDVNAHERRPSGQKDKGWVFEPDANMEFEQGKKPYTHLTGRLTDRWLGPGSLLDRLSPEVRDDLERRHVILLGRSPDQLWVNERGTTVTSDGKSQKTVVRPAQVVFKSR